jgi:hypothetical protein
MLESERYYHDIQAILIAVLVELVMSDSDCFMRCGDPWKHRPDPQAKASNSPLV